MPVCDKHPYVLYRADDPSIRVPKPCGAYRCVTCGRAKILERARVMTWASKIAGDVRLITLTRVPPVWQQAREQIKDFVRRLRKTYKFECAWSIEANPKKTGHHMHAIQWGTWIDKLDIKRRWGGRWIDIREIQLEKNGYAIKCSMVSGYLTKHTNLHLDINGGRAVHMTRGFLHGLTSREVLQQMSEGHEWRLAIASERDYIEMAADGLDEEGKNR